jgi:hypothetical protein
MQTRPRDPSRAIGRFPRSSRPNCGGAEGPPPDATPPRVRRAGAELGDARRLLPSDSRRAVAETRERLVVVTTGHARPKGGSHLEVAVPASAGGQSPDERLRSPSLRPAVVWLVRDVARRERTLRASGRSATRSANGSGPCWPTSTYSWVERRATAGKHHRAERLREARHRLALRATGRGGGAVSAVRLCRFSAAMRGDMSRAHYDACSST